MVIRRGNWTQREDDSEKRRGRRTRDYQKLAERQEAESPLQPQKETTLPTLISGFYLQDWQTISLCCLKPQVCGASLQQL